MYLRNYPLELHLSLEIICGIANGIISSEIILRMFLGFILVIMYDYS